MVTLSIPSFAHRYLEAPPQGLRGSGQAMTRVGSGRRRGLIGSDGMGVATEGQGGRAGPSAPRPGRQTRGKRVPPRGCSEARATEWPRPREAEERPPRARARGCCAPPGRPGPKTVLTQPLLPQAKSAADGHGAG